MWDKYTHRDGQSYGTWSKHVPVISAPEQVKRNQFFEVTVEVGKLREHPNEPTHFIEWIEVYSGDTFLFRTALAGSLSKTRVTVSVKLIMPTVI